DRAHPRELWTFVRPLLQDAICGQIDRDDRERLHRVALAFWSHRAEQTAEADRDRTLAAIARHAEALGDAPPSIAAHLDLGDRARAAHRYADADWHYTRALVVTGEDNLRQTARALRGRGSVRYRLHRVQESIDDLRRACRISVLTCARAEQAELLLEYSTALDWAGQYGASARCIDQIPGRIDLDAEPAIYARYLAARGRSEYRRGDTEAALATLARARRLLLREADTEWTLITLLLLGPLLDRDKQVDRAEQRFAEAAALCERTGDRFHLCVVYLNRAWLWLTEPDDPAEGSRRALDDLRRARRIARQTGQPILERGAVHNIAELYHWCGQHEAALVYARRALRLQRFLPEPVTTDALLLARVLIALRLWSEAKPHVERVRSLIQSERDTSQLRENLTLLALEQLLAYDESSGTPRHREQYVDTRSDARARWRSILDRAGDQMSNEELIEIKYIRALDAERQGDRDALVETVESIREDLAQTPLLSGLVRDLSARAAALIQELSET
ncbi:MAG: hypothetical protein AAGC55_15540, partial [Myxococcota bacterium]